MTEIKDILGRVTSRLERFNVKSYFPPDTVRSLGGKYWKDMTVAQKRSYLETTGVVTRDDINSDHHIGDADFHSAVLGYADRFINVVSDTVTDNYLEPDKDNPTFDFPEKLKSQIFTSKSSYMFSKLVENTASYVEKTELRKVSVPENSLATRIVFQHWDGIWQGIRKIGEMYPIEQQDLITSGLAPNSNSGWPYVSKQTKKTFPSMFKKFLIQIFPEVYAKHKMQIKDGYSLTVDIILDTVKQATKQKYFPPFILFYRTQGGKTTKHRSVFGGDMLMKALGALWAAAKKFKGDVVKFGPISWIAWDEWGELFTTIQNILPEWDPETNRLKPMNKVELVNIYGEYAKTLEDGEHIVDVYGEDFSGYDQSIIREDINWVSRHKSVGWIMKWILDCLSYSEVWGGPHRFKDIFFKSGHPFTSVFGSALHLQISCNAAEYMDATLLASTVLSDDNLAWWIGFNERKYLEYCKSLGFVIDPNRSSWFSRDKIVRFLAVLVGYIFSNEYTSYVGDPQSRYYGLAHSEREFAGQFGTAKMQGDYRDLWLITGDVELDAFLSKLGSFAESGTTWVLAILNAVKNTNLGRKAINAILALSSQTGMQNIRPYREDLFISFSPTWLAKLDVQDILLDQTLR